MKVRVFFNPGTGSLPSPPLEMEQYMYYLIFTSINDVELMWRLCILLYMCVIVYYYLNVPGYPIKYQRILENIRKHKRK